MKTSLLLLAFPLALSLAACRGSSNETSTTTTTNGPAATTAAAAKPAPTVPPVVTPAPKVATPASAANANECITLDAEDENNDGRPITLEGTVYVDKDFALPSSAVAKPFILKLSQKRCVKNGGDLKNATEIHLADPEGKMNLKLLLGKKVQVEGAPFHSHTAWHARDIVFTMTKANAI